MPLAPMLLTRPEPASRRFADAVAARLGPGPVVISPLLDIVPMGDVPSLAGYGGVILTSENGVLRRGAAWPLGLSAYCVGKRTARAAQSAGFTVHSADGALVDLISMIRATPPAGRLLHLRGRHVAGDVAKTLTQMGIPTDEAVVYDQRLLPLSADGIALLARPGPVLIPIFSTRSAQALVPSLKNIAASLHIAAISPAVAEALPVHSAAMIDVALRPDGEAMIDRIATLQAALGA